MIEAVKVMLLPAQIVVLPLLMPMDIAGATVGVTVIAIVAEPNELRVPTLQITCPFVYWHVPWVDTADTNVMLAGNTFVTLTDVAELGPEFITFNV